jgi:hypothetical protein
VAEGGELVSLYGQGKRLERLERLERLRGDAARLPPAFLRMSDGRLFSELTDEELATELERTQAGLEESRRQHPGGRDAAYVAWLKTLSDHELEAEYVKAEREASRG